MAKHTPKDSPAASAVPTNFIRNIVAADLAGCRFERRHWNGRPGDGSFQAQGHLDPARIRTRFPPEPNGYLHLGHAKSIFLNFGLARDFNGRCHLRFDDTNPAKEEQEYVDSIIDAVHWLGFDWNQGAESHLYFASDYFQFLYDCAEYLIRSGHAYVDQQSAEQMRLSRGTLTERGSDSPYRDRPASDSLDLLRQMRDGKHGEGEMILRARIDMASPNINLRDPALYRIRYAHHHRTGQQWCIYPMYDFAHALSDALESITHSVCTLEFEDHRPLYDWCVERCVPLIRAPQWQAALDQIRDIRGAGTEAAREFAQHCSQFGHKLFASAAEARMAQLFLRWEHQPDALTHDLDAFFDLLLGADAGQFSPLLTQALEERRPDPFGLPHQYEFSRLNLDYVVLSKRKLIQLVDEKLVDGWDDPRMPTLAGMRRRGYTASSLALFAERIGVSKADSRIDIGVLEQSVRDDLDPTVPRAMAVLDPLRLVITNLSDDALELCEAPLMPHRKEDDAPPVLRQIPLRRELVIERDDFSENPPPGFIRLVPGGMVRLRYAYVIRCTGVEHDVDGRVSAVLAELLTDTRSGTPGASAVKVKGAIHWLPRQDAIPAEVRIYDHLFTVPDPDSHPGDYRDLLSADSFQKLDAFVEPGLLGVTPEDRFQFERHGYFVADRVDHRPEHPIFNRIVGLKDTRGR